MKPIFDSTIQDILNDRLKKIEEHFNADVLFYYGSIFDGLDKYVRDFIEDLKKEQVIHKRLCVMINTPGGGAETVERIVRIIRHHYDEVFFVVPDSAYSAGTIFCMSGDKIFMDYSSSLGPIDPQVFNGKNWVPALGYLYMVEEMIKKEKLSEAELVLLKEQDIAMLRSYQAAKELTIELLKEWLVNFKFKNWVTHKNGQPVSDIEKMGRATEIADKLGDYKTWLSHGRSIGISTLTKVLKLEIDDYSNDEVLRPLIRDYNDLICQYILKNNAQVFFHTRKFI